MQPLNFSTSLVGRTSVKPFSTYSNKSVLFSSSSNDTNYLNKLEGNKDGAPPGIRNLLSGQVPYSRDSFSRGTPLPNPGDELSTKSKPGRKRALESFNDQFKNALEDAYYNDTEHTIDDKRKQTYGYFLPGEETGIVFKPGDSKEIPARGIPLKGTTIETYIYKQRKQSAK